MKKTIFLFAFSFVSLFASANEVEAKTLVLDQTKDLNTKEVTVSDEDESSELFVMFCVTHTNYWYEYSYKGMDGRTYEVYTVETTTNCYE